MSSQPAAAPGAIRTRAAVLRGPNKLAVEDLWLDPPAQNEILVRVARVGACRSDLHAIQGDTRVSYPTVPGHEASGTVEALGPGVDDFTIGDHVLLTWHPQCGECRFCARGEHSMCEEGSRIPLGPQMDGTFRRHTVATGEPVGSFCMTGAFAQHTVVHRASAIKVDEGVPLDIAALCSCSVPAGYGAATALARERRLGASDAVLVIGTGGDGVNVLQGLRAMGVGAIIAADVQQLKKELAPRFGATHVVDWTDAAKGADEVRRITNGLGVRALFLSTPAVTLDDGVIALVESGGDVVITALNKTPQPSAAFGFAPVVRRHIRITGVGYGGKSMRETIPESIEAAMRGSIDVAGIITGRYKLDDIVQAYKDLDEGKILRGMVHPWD